MLPLFLSPTRVIGEVPSEFQHVNYTLIIDKEKIIITDFLDKPQFVCSLNDLSKGIINSVCVDEKTKKYIPGTNTEVKINLSANQSVRKDAVLPDGKVVIIKPDTKSGHRAAVKREKLMQKNGYETQTIYYNPNDPAYLPTSPTYIGPKIRRK